MAVYNEGYRKFIEERILRGIKEEDEVNKIYYSGIDPNTKEGIIYRVKPDEELDKIGSYTIVEENREKSIKIKLNEGVKGYFIDFYSGLLQQDNNNSEINNSGINNPGNNISENYSGNNNYPPQGGSRRLRKKTRKQRKQRKTRRCRRNHRK